jgi:hypothetical protein
LIIVPSGRCHATLSLVADLQNRACDPGPSREESDGIVGITAISSWYISTGPVTTVPFHITVTIIRVGY